MPLEYNKRGVRFQYPENWTLDETDSLSGGRSVSVSSPGGAFWSLTVGPRGIDPSRLSHAAVSAMQEEYKDLEIEETREVVAGLETVGYNLSFFCFDLTNTAQVRSASVQRGTYTVFCQAEDREFARVGDVFKAITTSLLKNAKPADDGGDESTDG